VSTVSTRVCSFPPAEVQLPAAAQSARQGGRSGLRHRAITGRVLLALVATLLTVFLVVPSPVFASGSSWTLEKDLEQLNTDLESNSTLSNFSTFSSEHQQQDDYALADFGFLEKEFTGSDPSLGFLAPPPSGPALSPVETYINDLKTGVETIIPGGTTEGAIGAEMADTASAAGMYVGAGALATVPLTAVLGYEDITTGSNVIYRALFSGPEDYAKVEAEGGVAAEGLRWERFERVKCMRGGEIAKVDDCINKWFEETYGRFGSVEHEEADHLNDEIYNITASEAPYWEGGPVYILEPKISGHYYIGALAFSRGGGEWPWEPDLSEGCFVYGVAGWPVHLLHVATTILTGPFPRDCEYETSHVQEYDSAVVVRTPSRMHEGLPRTTTKTAVEKLESEGHPVRKTTGYNQTKAGELGPAVKKEVEKEKEGGQKRQHEAFCHWMGCETEKVPAKTETPLEPESPEKPEGEVPPLPAALEMPSCFVGSLTGTECVELIKSRGFETVELDPRTWETADVSKPAESVLRQSPVGGSVVETAVSVTVEENPSPAAMPLFLPKPEPGENATHYKERVEREGWTKVTTHIDTEPSTEVSPGDVTKVDPDPEARLDPSTEPKTKTEVVIHVQPEASPEPGLPPGAGFSSPGCGLTPPTASINLTPVTSHSFGSVFPFSVLTWLSGTFSGIAESPREPHAVLHVFGSEVETGNGFAPLATVFTLVRDTIAAFMWLGVAWFLWNRTIGSRVS
jgi:hypothetical protein